MLQLVSAEIRKKGGKEQEKCSVNVITLFQFFFVGAERVLGVSDGAGETEIQAAFKKHVIISSFSLFKIAKQQCFTYPE